MKRQSTRTRKAMVVSKCKTHIGIIESPKQKRKQSVLDWLGEPRPTTPIYDETPINEPPPTTAISADILPPVIMEALDNGDMLRISNGEIQVKRRVYNQFSPVSGDDGLAALPMLATDNVDLVFTLPRALLERTQMICCVIEESTMAVRGFN